MKIIIDRDRSGKTVLALLRGHLGLSGAFIKRLKFIEDGICVNGRHVTVRYTLAEGDMLELRTEDTLASEKIAPYPLPLDIIYEDEYIVVPSKPSNMPTHPSRDHYDDTVANALAHRYRGLDVPFVFRPVNRLDRNTSGLVIIARDRLSASTLFDSMRRGEIEKEYVAILHGTLPAESGEIRTYMKRSSESIIVRKVCDECEGADLAVTRYSLIATNGEYSAGRATPVTGRTHQLRVHFSHLGCPIVGDDMYGTESPYIDRQALHAHKLKFPHPREPKALELHAPLPDEMLTLIDEVFDAPTSERIKGEI